MGGSKRRTSSSLYVAVQDAGLGFNSWRDSVPREGLPLFGRIGNKYDPMEWTMTGEGEDKPRRVVEKGVRRYKGKVQWQNALREYACRVTHLR